jgi:hypothetical protein
VVTVEITVGKDGKSTVEVNGMKGQGCEAVSEAFRNALGESGPSEPKPEFYEGNEQTGEVAQ